MVWWLKAGKKWRELPADIDGFGQSLFEDFRFFWRFSCCRNVVLSWRTPTEAEKNAQAGHPVMGRFGDEAYAVADWHGQQWIVRERDFYGWPAPPRYVFFAWRGDRIWVARDFDAWPRGWRRPVSFEAGAGFNELDRRILL